MNKALVVLCSVAYLALLFGIAGWIERRKLSGKSIPGKNMIYPLSLAVYCTGWTYYGSVGHASLHGMQFLSIYLGPLICCALFVPVIQKILRICRTQRINSVADFISTRYGKNFSLGVIVTLCYIFGVIPYIALQLKAISDSFHVITGMPGYARAAFWHDDSFYITILLALFVIVFGTRKVDVLERHEGLVGAIAFESVIKLVAFLIAGGFITYGIFGGFKDLFAKANAAGLQHLFIMDQQASGYSTWMSMILVSMMAVVLLPRQFQVLIVENKQERQLRRAIWLFPLYLFAINIFVMPIAVGGILTFGSNAGADTFVISLPMHYGMSALSLLVYIGGFSAATGMIMVETIALATMVSNHLILPPLLSFRNSSGNKKPLTRTVLMARRGSIIFIFVLAFGYDKLIAPYFSLVSIGLISMAAVTQLAPAMIGGLYWKNASRKGAIFGILTGFIIWFYTLILPSVVNAGLMDKSITQLGPWGIGWLRPQALFGLNDLELLPHSVFWSLFFNVLSYAGVSIYSRLNAQEVYTAEIFTGIFTHTATNERRAIWKGSADMKDVVAMVANFIGQERAENLINAYALRHRILVNQEDADPRMVSFAERILSGVIGSASARFMISSITKEEDIGIDEVLSIVRESQQVLELNKELKKKSIELTRATDLLTTANRQLLEMDGMKDEFLNTVTHELRTPLTSIRALSEILYDNPEMEEEQRVHYLDGIIKETERLTRLITEVLNLERYESGRQKLRLGAVDIASLIQQVIEALKPLAKEQGAALELSMPNAMFIVQCDAEMIYQVLYNLISNALKFVPAANGRVHVILREAYTELQIWVEDNGRGIDPEIHELIFDKFFQARNQTLQKPVGSGLGLAICKRIIEMHEGRIWVESEKGKGARFAFSLPVN